VHPQLGYRTQRDIAEARLREVSQHRFTSLDRAITRDGPPDSESSHFQVSKNPAQPLNQCVVARLSEAISPSICRRAPLVRLAAYLPTHPLFSRGRLDATVEETAQVLKVSADTVARCWKLARAWLLAELRSQD